MRFSVLTLLSANRVKIPTSRYSNWWRVLTGILHFPLIQLFSYHFQIFYPFFVKTVWSVYLFLIFHGGFHRVRHLMLFNRVSEIVDVAEWILSVYHASNLDYNLFIMPVVRIENSVFNPSMSLSFALSYWSFQPIWFARSLHTPRVQLQLMNSGRILMDLIELRGLSLEPKGLWLRFGAPSPDFLNLKTEFRVRNAL